MTAELWLPGVLVLALGALVGWWFTRSRAGADAATPRSVTEAQPALELADLLHRRDELYARLRGADLDPGDRSDLELEAAGVLQQLDAMGQEGASPIASEDEETRVDLPPLAVPHSRVRSLLTGFAFGGGTVALVAVLVFWAGRDATERDEMSGSSGSARVSSEEPHPVGELPPEVQAEVAEISAHLEAKPDDVAARKRLALLYLSGDQYVSAFEQAQAVLAVVPDDIDSLYVQGVVRMTMGQDDLALEQLDRVLELFPEHVRAMTVKGLIYARRGDGDRAALTWNQALEVGGPQPQIENLLAMLEAEATGALPPGHPTAADTGEAGQFGRAESLDSQGLTAPGEYRARVEADVIEGFPQTGTLFVALRGAAGGPPIAVQRIDRPAFPVLVSLGSQDMMMAEGGELPESGTLSVRLDQDGSASTKGEDDLEGSAEMNRGDLVTIVLD